MVVEEVQPDLTEAHECFRWLPAYDFAPLSKAALLRSKRDLLKPEIIWNIEQSLQFFPSKISSEPKRKGVTMVDAHV